MTPSKQQIKDHYEKAAPVIKAWGENDGCARIGSNGPGSGWYEYPEGYDGNIRRPRVLTDQGKLSKDFDKLVRNAAREAGDDEKIRSIYSTLNFLDPDGGYIQEKEPEKVWSGDGELVQGNPLPEYRDIEFMTLFADVDLKSEHKRNRKDEKIKETVRKAIEVYVREFKKLAPNSINVLDSGGGFYPFIHHDVTKPISEEFEGEDRGLIFDELTDRFNERLEVIWETVKKEVPGAEENLDPDMLNNKNRLMKVPLSIHRSLDVVVHPIDLNEPDFEAEAPNDESIIEKTNEWLDDRNADKSDIETLISELWPDRMGSWDKRLGNWLRERKIKREKRRKERLEQKRKMEERWGELGGKGETIKGFSVTNSFEDILATLETIDVRDMASAYITDERDGQQPRFDPPWRSSESGASCFASREKFVDINEGNTGGGPAKFAAREHGIILSCDEDLEGEDWWKALDLLRQEYGYKIPVLIPDVNTEMPGEDGTAYDQTPHWAIVKAGFAFGIIDESDLAEKETEEDEEDEEYLPIGAVPAKYNKILRELEDRGFEHGRDKKYFKRNPNGKMKFVPKLLGDDILHDHHFATMEESGELYVYRNGVYQRKGEAVVGKLAQERLEADATNTRIRETTGYIKRATYRPTEEFGAGKREIGVENGLLNLETRELEELSPDKLILTKLPVKYDPGAECAKDQQFIRDIVADGGDVKKIQEMLGYTLLKENPLNKAFMGLGGGGNGRSTLFELFTDFLGEENTAGVGLIELFRNRFASADLFGNIADFSADISNRKIKHSGRFKKLVGEDRIRAEHKNQDAFHFKCYATPWFSANELPETKDKTRSFYRRWIIIQFPYTFTSDEEELEKEGFKKKNPEYPDPLTTDEELSGLLNWALDGLDRVLENNKFTNERTLEQKRDLWELESDPIADFLDKWCIKKKGLIVPKEIVRQAYSKFCEEEDNDRVADQILTKRLKKHGITTTRPRTEEHGRVQCYQGFGLDPEIVKEKGLIRVVGPFFNSFYNSLEEEKVLSEYKDKLQTTLTTPTKEEATAEPEDLETPEGSQYDKVQRVMEIIGDLEEGPKGGAPINEVKEEAKAEGIGEDFVEEMIKREKRNGRLYSPEEGQISRATR